MTRRRVVQLMCPECGEPASVEFPETRLLKNNNYVKRRRVCPSGHETETLEIPSRVVNDFQSTLDDLRRSL